ncbi:Muconolactone Delta-isomerase [Pandoraea captiosa]|jgi:muconolactone D-isomerase|uniref:Muconolactone Delta-isomerase n=1 Tax=Pandoraea captiosa TaxID=2508302 RepID=A0A5E4ZKC1_9BURK|nr:muconolactone Delta-isomerase family protein [Pandoraea captiosa]VVE61298.1 Muconolactone Delta-isomerase [Pandoraea captiosa]
MEFLLHISFRPLLALSETKQAQVVQAEREAADRLRKAGRLVRLWRVPCRPENMGIWSAADATDLHDMISTLPAFPFFDEIKVTPLAEHPVESR